MPLPLGSDLPPPAGDLSTRLLARLETALAEQPQTGTLWVGCSGGLDSLLLLWAVARIHPQRVQALHVHHGLQPAADAWADHLTALCSDWGLALTVERVQVESGSNLEARARAARYQAFGRCLQPDDTLLLAHHRDDQLETLLLRLVRGAGLDGLAGMPASRPLGQGRLVRPWLQEARADLEQLAAALQLPWLEDPSNLSLQHDRNFLRHQVLPQMRQRWPGLEQSMSRSQSHLQSAAERLQRLDATRLQTLQRPDGSLDLDALQELETLAERQSVLRLWLHEQGPGEVSQAQLEHLLFDVVAARVDAQGELALGSWRIRRYDGGLYAVPLLPGPPAEPLTLPGDPQAGYQLHHAGLGTLTLQMDTAGTVPGLDAARLGQCRLTVRARQGGERLRPAGRQGSRDLKRLLQELDIPPWLRPHLPLLFADDQLVAIADLVLDQQWLAPSGSPSLIPHWQQPRAIGMLA